ncbi:hypothetical protein BZL41_08515 [Pseudomonas sp. PIC25]|nr:hypothetical protein BZL41_08515 [Pseudomonas sp. PIC25]
MGEGMRKTRWLFAGGAVLLAAITGMAGYAVGLQVSGDRDLFCPGGFQDYRTRVVLRSDQGVTIPADTVLRLRFCEYNAQARLEFRLDKGDFDTVEPLPDDPERGRWLYGLGP